MFREDIFRIIWLLVFSITTGALFDQLTLCLLLGALGYIFWLHLNLNRLYYWVLKWKKNPAPEANGIFDTLVGRITSAYAQDRRRKKKLSKYLKRYRMATAALPDGTVVIDDQGRIQWANTMAATYLGIKWPADKHQRLSNLIRNPLILESLDNHSEEQINIEIPSPIDDQRQLSIRITPYGQHQRLFVARDITRLHRVSTIRKDFVANVSHELRTPLTVLSGYLESLQHGDLPEPESLRSLLQAMGQQTERMQNIVEELLLLSRLEQSDTVEHPQPVIVAEMLSRIHTAAQSIDKQKTHIFLLQADADLQIVGNPHELYSAISNLVFNAVRYTPDHGVIQIQWYRHAEGAQLLVKDNGIGIDAVHLPRLTERFYRVDRGRSREDGGTGLGLAITKHVLSRHSASLLIDSEVGEGSSFLCDFPPQVVISAEHSAQSNDEAV